MRRQIENIIANAEEFTIDDSVDEILDLFSVMLSEAKRQAINHKCFKYDNNIYDKPITDAYEHAIYMMEKSIKNKIDSA